jgi:hypothetical protein
VRNALAIGNEFAADCDGVGHARIMIVLVARDGRAAVEALRGTATYKEGPAQGRERQALLRDGASWASPASDTLTDDMPTTGMLRVRFRRCEAISTEGQRHLLSGIITLRQSSFVR